MEKVMAKVNFNVPERGQASTPEGEYYFNAPKGPVKRGSCVILKRSGRHGVDVLRIDAEFENPLEIDSLEAAAKAVGAVPFCFRRGFIIGDSITDPLENPEGRARYGKFVKIAGGTIQVVSADPVPLATTVEVDEKRSRGWQLFIIPINDKEQSLPAKSYNDFQAFVEKIWKRVQLRPRMTVEGVILGWAITHQGRTAYMRKTEASLDGPAGPLAPVYFVSNERRTEGKPILIVHDHGNTFRVFSCPWRVNRIIGDDDLTAIPSELRVKLTPYKGRED